MWIVLQLVGLALLASVAYAAANGAPWVPTRPKDLEAFIKALELKPGEKFYELGAGDGRVCIAVARKFPEAEVVGVELSVVQYLAARLRVWRSGLKNVRILWRNAFKVSLKDAAVVYVFLLPETNGRLDEKFRRELRPGARVYTYAFRMDGWTPTREFSSSPDGLHVREYVYPQSTGK